MFDELRLKKFCQLFVRIVFIFMLNKCVELQAKNCLNELSAELENKYGRTFNSKYDGRTFLYTCNGLSYA